MYWKGNSKVPPPPAVGRLDAGSALLLLWVRGPARAIPEYGGPARATPSGMVSLRGLLGC